MKIALFLLCVAVQSPLATVPSGGYASYLGGRSDDYGAENAYGIDVDSEGNAYVGGASMSQMFPATRRYGPTENGGFVVKINSTGAEKLYAATFTGLDILAVKLTTGNQLYALALSGAEPRGFVNLGIHGGGYTDAAILKLDPQGTLLWARYIGGSDMEMPRGLAVDAAGNVYIAGFTTSTNFPTTSNAVQRNYSAGFEGFVAKLNSQGDVIYSTYLGGESSQTTLGIAVDAQERAVITGTAVSETVGTVMPTKRFGSGGASDVFVCRLNAAGSALDWLTLMGGSSRDAAIAVQLDSSGGIVLLGSTESADFPITNSAVQTNLLGGADLFVMRLSLDGQSLSAGTYFGSTEGEGLGDPFYVEYTADGTFEQRSLFPESAGLAIGTNGEIHIAGRNNSPNWPTARDFPLGFGGSRDSYIARFSATLNALLDFRFFGGGSDDEARAIAVDAAGNSYLAGTAYAPSQAPFFVTSTNAFQPDFGGSAMDAMVVKIPAARLASANDSFERRMALSGTRTSAASLLASNTAWFTWRAPGDGRIIASTAGSTFETVLRAFSGGAPTLLNAGTDRLTIPVTSGLDYHIEISGPDATGQIARLSLAFSQPPNDDFANAFTISGFPASVQGTNINSTVEPNEPTHDDHIPARSVWWKWTAPDARSVAVSTDGSSFDTVLGIYRGATLSDLERVTSNDDISGESRASEAVFLAQTGETYFVAVDGPPDNFGTVKLRITSNEPPGNDSFSTRSNLTGIVQQVTSSNLRATREPSEPGLSFTNSLSEVDAAFSGSTVWWEWTAPRDGRLHIDTLGSDFDTRLGVYTGVTLSNLARVAAHDDVNRQLDQRTSVVEFDVVSGVRYLIQVDGSTGRPAGVVRLNLRLTFPPRITSFSRREEGWRLQAEGVPGTNYRLEQSTDLVSWAPFTAPQFSMDGLWEFSIRTPVSTPIQLFIRLATIE
jgi:hypothetical protein